MKNHKCAACGTTDKTKFEKGRYSECHECRIRRGRKAWESTSERYREDWREFLVERYGENPKCAICGRELEYMGGKTGSSVHFDHREPSEPYMSPAKWFQRPLYGKRRSDPQKRCYREIFEAEGYGILCHRCNAFLPAGKEKRKKLAMGLLAYLGYTLKRAV